MYRPNQPNRPDAAHMPADYHPRIIVKLHDHEDTRARVASLAVADTGHRPAPEPGGGSAAPSQFAALIRRFPGAQAGPLFGSATPARLQSMAREAERAAGRPIPNPNHFYAVTVPHGADPNAMVAAARELEGVEHAYVQGAPTPPPLVNAADDPRAANQGYLNAAPAGIDARYAWTIPCGDGSGIALIDVEQGWTLGHEDLTGAHVTLLSGLNSAYFGHGTAVLGEILAQDNTRGCVGIVPLVSARVVSQKRSTTNYSTSDAIIAAILATRPGDVILLEAQTTVSGSTFLPVEVEFDVWLAILIGTCMGRVIVEAGGNGSNDLDNYRDPAFGYILKRGHANFRESGAIMVGAASSAVPHTRLGFSNFGSRIDCYAWGENIDTTGDGWTGNVTTTYTTSFGGTSGATPIITGAAIALQAMAKCKTGSTLTPARVRQVLCDPRNGTASGTPATDRIGVMPDLRKIVAAQRLAPTPRPVGDFPTPRADVRVAALVDAGHGGADDSGLSSAYGSPNARGGAAEKDINLHLARRVCDQLGPRGVLTRSGDYNLTLRQRIERARATKAAAFVSIHSNTGRTDHGGPEVWVFGDGSNSGGAASQKLAQRIGQELAGIEHAPVPVRAGKLAVLRPDLHGPGVAAVLVETGSLQHAASAARLHDARALDEIGAAVARGVSQYLSNDFGGRAAYGGADTPWQDDAPGRDAGGIAVLDPSDEQHAQACFCDTGEALQSNWWDAALPVGALTDTAPPELREMLAYNEISYATFAPREGAYFAALSEHLRRHGTVPAGTTLDRSNYTAAVRAFQASAGVSVDGIPNERTLWELQKDWAPTRRLGTVRVQADRFAGSGGYDSFRLRSDIVDRYQALRAAVLAAGGIITSAGSFRELTAAVTAARSSTSMHYSGLALDLATDTGMQNTTRNPYLIAREGRKWRVFCRSSSAPERSVDAVIWAHGAVRTETVTAKVFDFTALAEANGFSSIPARSGFPGDYMSAEWWHFQCELPLVPYFSQFGIELLSLAAYTEAELSRHTGIWSNRMKVFKRGRGGWY